jgi:hypothetical protein
MSRSVTGFTPLCLYRRETVTFPSNRPSNRTLVCQFGELGYMVGVYPFPNNNIKSIPHEDWCHAVKIKDTLLVIIPLSLSESSGEESKSENESGIKSNLSGVSLQINPDTLWLGRQNYYAD